MIPKKLEKVDSKMLEQRISEVEYRIVQHQLSAARHTDALRRSVHDRLTKPSTLAMSSGVGILLERFIMPTREPADDGRPQGAQREEEAPKSPRMQKLKRLQRAVTLVTTTLALLGKADQYSDDLNDKAAELDRESMPSYPH